MAQLIDFLKYSGARDSTGAVVASGKVYFYQPGTVSTQVTVYTDEDGLSALTQPLTLDAAGRGTVYTKRDVQIVVRNAADTSTISTTDRSNTTNARAVEVENAKFMGEDLTLGGQVAGGRTDLDAILTLLGTSAGGTDGKFNQGGTDDMTLEDAIGWCIQAAEYGCVGDDATDNGTDLNAAIAAAMAANKPLYIGPGTFRTTAALTATGATATGLVIFGAGRATTVIKNMSTSNDLLTIDLSSAIEGHIVVRDIGFTANTVSSGAALRVTNGNGPVFERCNVALHRTGYHLTGSTYAGLFDCLVTSTDSNSASIGFSIGPQSYAERCRVTAAATGTGFSLASANTHLMNCKVDGAATAYSLTGAFCSVHRSRAVDCTTGFSLAAADCVATLCNVGGTITTGFSVGAVARSGCESCTSTVGGTADFATNAAATFVIERGNTFTTRSLNEKCPDFGNARPPLASINITSQDSLSAPTPDPNYEYNVFRNTGGGSITMTIGATSTTGLRHGQRMSVVLVDASGAFTVTSAWNAQYVGGPSDTSTAGDTEYMVVNFVWNANTSKWQCVDPLLTAPGAAWRSGDWA